MSTVAERLAQLVSIDPATGCHNFAGSLDSHGYGRMKVSEGGKKRTVRTHIVAYELAHGEVPEGFVLDHLCRNPRCCNPAHLEVVTQRENTLRGVGPSAENAAKTHCKRGHEYTADNIYLRPDGRGRQCKICKTAANNGRLPPLEASRDAESSRASSPEKRCQDCAGPNPVWFAPSPLWNLVMGGPEAKGDPGGIVCPVCFIARAEAAGTVPTAWVLSPEPSGAVVSELVEALTAMVDAEVDYMTRNHLGDPEKQHNIKRARAALSRTTGGAA